MLCTVSRFPPICAEVGSAFHDFFLLVFLICPVLVVALLILLGHRTVNRDPCILYSRVGAGQGAAQLHV